MKMLPATAFSLFCMLVVSAQAQNIPTNCNLPQDVASDCGLAFASAFSGMAESFCNGNCPQRYANALASNCGSTGTNLAQLIQQGCGRNSQNQYCFSFFTQTTATTQCQNLGCCAQATLAAPGFTSCPATEPCTAPFSLSGDGGNTNGGGSNTNGGGNMNGGSNNSINAGNGGSSNMNGIGNIPTNCNLPLDVARDCSQAYASAATGMAGSFCSGNCPERLANAFASNCGSAGTELARQIQQGCGRNSQNQYCFSFFTQTTATTQCQNLGCCAQATLAAPAFANCPTTEPCTAPFSLSGDGGNTNGGGSNTNGGGNMNGGSNNSTNAGSGGSISMNGIGNIPTNCNLPLDVARDCGVAFASAFSGIAESFCNGNCPQRYANTLASNCGSAGTNLAQLIQQGCGRNSQNQYCFSFFTQTTATTQCQNLGCCAQATLAAPAFASCPTTEPCTAPFSLSGDSNGGSPSINSMATMFTSFLLATVALLFHS